MADMAHPGESSNIEKKCLAALLFTTPVMVAELMMTPIASQLFLVLDHEAAANFVISAPMLTSMASSLAAGFLLLHMDKKKLLLTGVSCFLIGGLTGTLFPDAVWMSGMRLLVGLGIGCSNVSALAIISDLVSDEKARSRVNGKISAGISISGVFLTFFAGLIAEFFGWQKIALIHLIGLPMLWMVCRYVPSCPPAPKTRPAADDGIFADAEENCKKSPVPHQNSSPGVLPDDRSRQTRESMNRKVAPAILHGWLPRFGLLIFSEFVWFLLYGFVFFQISVYVEERGIGSAAFSGSLSSLGSLAAFGACLLFGSIYAYSKNFCAAVHYTALAAGFFLLAFFRSRTAAAAACVISGYGYGNALSYYVTRAGSLLPKRLSPVAAASFAFTSGIGLFLSGYAAAAAKALLNTESFAAVFAAALPAAAVGALLAVCRLILCRPSAV